VTFQVLTAVIMYITSTTMTIIALMMEAVHTSETSVYFNETTRRYTPEGCNFELHRTYIFVREFEYVLVSSDDHPKLVHLEFFLIRLFLPVSHFLLKKRRPGRKADVNCCLLPLQ
jgi:hypothetical protein